MTSSADSLSYATPAAPLGTLTIALAGNPNSGKTTIFNALTGLRQKVANYPGVTVEKKTGRTRLPDGQWADVVDLPGTYSLISRSPDEHVAMEVLRGLRPDTKAPDVVVVVVDASNLQRNLYLVSQLIELGRPMVVALNMTDVAERRRIDVSAEALERELRVPVIPIVGHRRRGIDDLKAAIARAAVAPLPDWPVPEAIKQELELVGAGLATIHAEDALKEGSAFRFERFAPSRTARHDAPESPPAMGESKPETREVRPDSSSDRYRALAERLLIGDRAADIADIASHQPVASLLSNATTRLQALGIDPMQADIEAHYRWIDGVSERVSRYMDEHPVATGTLGYETPKPATLTDKADAVLVHKVWGLVIFAMIMAGLFVCIFLVADPMMGAIEDGIAWLGNWVSASMDDGPLKSLVTDGIFAGIGGVVVFVPQIAMLFMFLAILEDSGYLARAAFLMDKVLGKVGLHGKAFIPLLSSFACAIPGIMAARTIESRKDRLATIFVAPFMSCSARLPVYILLIGAFFGTTSAFVQGGIMLACYVLGVLAAVVTAWFFKRTLLKGPAQAFILELPSYKVPQISQVLRVMWTNTAKFLTRAGTIIFCLSVVLWAMSYYPRLPEERVQSIRQKHTPGARTAALWDAIVARGETPDEKNLVIREMELDTVRPDPIIVINGSKVTAEEWAERTEKHLDESDEVQEDIGAAQSEHSIAGRIGHAIEPAIKPLGYDWKIGVGLIGAFAAREVFVSTLGITYAVSDAEDDAGNERLRQIVAADYTPLIAVSLLIWFVLAMQCMSTLAVVRRETGTWRWPIFMLVYMNALAYVVCLAVYQVGKAVA